MGVYIYCVIVGILNWFIYGFISMRDLYFDFNFMNIIYYLIYINFK